MRTLILTLLLILVAVIWGWTFTLVSDAVKQFDVSTFLAVRFTVGFLCLAPFLYRRIDREILRVGIMIGTVLAASYMLQTIGICFTTPTNSGLITGLFVAFTPALNWLVFRVKSPPAVWAAVSISIAGLYLLVGWDPQSLNVGDLWTLACAAGFGLHIAMLGRWSVQFNSFALAGLQTGTAALLFWLCVLLAPILPAHGENKTDEFSASQSSPSAEHLDELPDEPLPEPSAELTTSQAESEAIRPTISFRATLSSAPFWSAVMITGVLATAFGFGVQTRAQQELPAARIALILIMEPVFAAIFGYLLNGDRLTGVQWTGASLIVAAMLISELIPVSTPGHEPEA